MDGGGDALRDAEAGATLPEGMRRTLGALRAAGESVALVELARRLLALDALPAAPVARRLVAGLLGARADALPERLAPAELRPAEESAVAATPLERARFAVVDLETTGLSDAPTRSSRSARCASTRCARRRSSRRSCGRPGRVRSRPRSSRSRASTKPCWLQRRPPRARSRASRAGSARRPERPGWRTTRASTAASCAAPSPRGDAPAGGRRVLHAAARAPAAAAARPVRSRSRLRAVRDPQPRSPPRARRRRGHRAGLDRAARHRARPRARDDRRSARPAGSAGAARVAAGAADGYSPGSRKHLLLLLGAAVVHRHLALASVLVPARPGAVELAVRELAVRLLLPVRVERDREAVALSST